MYVLAISAYNCLRNSRIMFTGHDIRDKRSVARVVYVTQCTMWKANNVHEVVQLKHNSCPKNQNQIGYKLASLKRTQYAAASSAAAADDDDVSGQ